MFINVLPRLFLLLNTFCNQYLLSAIPISVKETKHYYSINRILIYYKWLKLLV